MVGATKCCISERTGCAVGDDDSAMVVACDSREFQVIREGEMFASQTGVALLYTGKCPTAGDDSEIVCVCVP